MNYANLKDSYLFYNIAKKTEAYLAKNVLVQKIYRLGIGDVSLPLCSAVITALHSAVDDQAEKATFQGYVDECGEPFLRKAIASHYAKRGVVLGSDEVFISSGASDELGDILDLFDKSSSALVIEPAYPAYVDANVMAGRWIIHLPSGVDNGFLPEPSDNAKADLIYLCSPNNPTGAVFTKDQLRRWVDFANQNGSIILFDAAYEAFIENENLPHSIFEIEGARECAVECCSFSKNAGFTGVRCAYTVIPRELTATADGRTIRLGDLWRRRSESRSNGVSYPVQCAAAASLDDIGRAEINALVSHYLANARIILDGLKQAGLTCYGGVNSPYVWLKTPDGMSSWDFFDMLLRKAQVVGTPGAGFGAAGEGYFRLTAFNSEENTRRAVERIISAI
jgi:LL-diaminopimelate aminotransferase